MRGWYRERRQWLNFLLLLDLVLQSVARRVGARLGLESSSGSRQERILQWRTRAMAEGSIGRRSWERHWHLGSSRCRWQGEISIWRLTEPLLLLEVIDDRLLGGDCGMRLRKCGFETRWDDGWHRRRRGSSRLECDKHQYYRQRLVMSPKLTCEGARELYAASGSWEVTCWFQLAMLWSREGEVTGGAGGA